MAESAFTEIGLKDSIEYKLEEIRELYLSDEIPWVIGYSGGKDSTAILQLLWMALEGLPAEKRTKQVYVITTDTLVENPIVALWVESSQAKMGNVAEKKGFPITPHMLFPEIRATFWVNLIGRGYPAPKPKFRWCTHRLKIDPSIAFISNVVKTNGEAIIVIGTRSAESAQRAKTIKRHAKNRTRKNLNYNPNLPNSYIYTPIVNWSNDDVWLFLLQYPNPWNHDNKYLMNMYRGASADGECPVVLDTSTPSCGNSRFGCWVCTLVDEDRSMQAMIQNDEEKEWMLPLLDLRNELDEDDKSLRDFRRMSGNVQLYNDNVISGPYTQKAREMWLRKLLQAQKHVRAMGPEEIKHIELITLDELREIRRLWVIDKHEIEDLLPNIYQEEVGQPFPDERNYHTAGFSQDELDLLLECCDGDELHYQLVRELLHVEMQYRTMARRSGLFDALDRAMKKGFYKDREDAHQRALDRQATFQEIDQRFDRTETEVH